MSVESHQPDHSLSLEALERVAEQCLLFGQAWHRGEQPSIEQFLEGFAGPEREELLRELLLAEFAHLSQAGVMVSFADYDQRFPADRPIVTAVREHFRNDATILHPRGKPPQPGDRLHFVGDYELLQEINRGGMGIVYKARKLSLGQIVAVKMLINNQFASHEDIERFQREAKLPANLSHPNIVGVHDVGCHEGHPYFSMDYVAGQSLAEMVRQHPLPPRQAARYVQVAAAAVHKAHEAGILHRDLKPSNILIDSEDQVRITDFGLAKQVNMGQTLTEAGGILGTPSYMPPEQAVGNQAKVGIASDVYSLGAVLYELLTARPPFAAATVLDTLHQVKTQEPVSPRVLNPKVPKDLETVCLKCLEKEPHQRFSTAAQLAQDLALYLEGRPITTRPVGSLEKSWRWCKRRPSIAGLIAAVVLTFLIGIASTTTFALIADERARENANLAVRERGLREQSEQAHLAAQAAEKQAEAAAKRADREAALAKMERDAAQRHEMRTAGLLYANNIRLAQVEWERNKAELALQYLEDCRWDLRGWEHDYLYTLFHHGGINLPEKIGGSRCIALSPDGQRILTGGGKKALTIWDALTGVELLTFHEQEDLINCAAFSPDGRRIVSASRDKTVKVWDAQTGAETLNFRGHDGVVSCLVFSPDGATIASSCLDGDLKLWNSATGEVNLAIKTNQSIDDNGLAFSPDGRLIASADELRDDGGLKVWDVATGQERFTLPGNFHGVYSVAFSPDGRRIASGGGMGTIKVWDVMTRQEVLSLEGPKGSGSINCVAFSPDGRRIVSGTMNGTIQLWNADTGQETIALSHPSGVNGVAFSPDGRKIVSSGYRTTRLWDASMRPETLTIRANIGGVTGVAFSPDGTRIVNSAEAPGGGAGPGEIKVWNTITGQKLFTIKGHQNCWSRVAFSPDGRWIASRGWDEPLKLWDAETGLELPSLPGTSGARNCFAFSPDGRRVIGDAGSVIRVWDVRTGQQVLTLKGHTSDVNWVAYSPDGRLIASSSWDRSIKLWDAATGQEIHTLQGHTDEVYPIAFSPDSRRLVSSGRDATVRVWNVKNGESLLVLRGHAGLIYCVAFSPDGNRIISAGSDKFIKLWNAATGEELLNLAGHKEGVSGVEFHPDGKRIVSSSFDGTIKVWTLPSVP